MKIQFSEKIALAIKPFLFISLILIQGSTVFSSNDPDENTRRYALLVGCTDYPGLRKMLGEKTYKYRIHLKGPTNDVKLMREMLMQHLGFPDDDINTLAGWPEAPEERPTLQNIDGHLTRLAGKVKKGDQVVILLAGHGTRQADHDGDELDGMDEVFLPADVTGMDDGRGGIRNALTDDLILQRVEALRDAGAFVWIIMDACHAGTMVRGTEQRIRGRGLDRGLLGLDSPESHLDRAGNQQRTTPSVGFTSLDNIVAFYAAQSFHIAPEMDLPDKDSSARRHGLFTFMIARQLARFSGRQTFDELLVNVIAAYQALPYAGTIPFAEGDVHRRISGGLSDLEMPLFLSFLEDGPRLNGGTLAALVEGTLLDVYLPGKTGESPVGRVEITESGFIQSLCTVTEGDALMALAREQQPTALPARVVERPFGDYSLKIASVTPDHKPLALESLPEEARRCFTDNPKSFPFVEDPADADWLLMARDEDLWLEPTRTVSGHCRFDVEPDALEHELRKIFRARNLKRLAGSGLLPDLDPGLKIEVRRKAAGPDGEEYVPLKSGGTFRPGDEVKIILTNTSGRIFDVTVLFIDADNGIQCFYPPRYRSTRLSHLETKPVEIPEKSDIVINDRQLGVEHLLIIAIPREGNSEEVTFRWLAQDSLLVRTRGGQSSKKSNPFSALMRELAFGSSMRGIDIVPNEISSATMRLITCRTDWPPPRPPSNWMGNVPLSLQGEEFTTDSWPASVPPPRRIGPKACLACSAPGEGHDILLGGDVLPTRILIDVDGDSPRDSPDPMAMARTFEAEAAFHFLQNRKIAYYDTDNDGRFDLILIDQDRGPEADTRYIRTNETWRREDGVSMPWLSTGYLVYLEMITGKAEPEMSIQQAVNKFAVLTDLNGTK